MHAHDVKLLSRHLFLVFCLVFFTPVIVSPHFLSVFVRPGARAQFDAVLNALVMQTSLLASQVTRRGIRIVAYILLLAHVFACFWFYLGWARVSDAAGTRDGGRGVGFLGRIVGSGEGLLRGVE